MKPSILRRTYAMPERSDRLDFYIRDQSTRAAITESHQHDYFQIQINMGGDTLQHIGSAIRPFPRGAIACILPHRTHYIPHPEASRFVVINFSSTFLFGEERGDAVDQALAEADAAKLKRFPELQPFLWQEQVDYVLSDVQASRVQVMLDEMLSLNEQRSYGAVLMLRGALLQLIGQICQYFAEPLQAVQTQRRSMSLEPAGQRDAMARVMRYLHRHLADPELTLASASRATFISPNHLSHRIKRETNKTFTQWVNAQRIAQAQRLLLDASPSIKEVALLVGYRDEQYFTRRFRLALGCTPSAFRARQADYSPARPEIYPGMEAP